MNDQEQPVLNVAIVAFDEKGRFNAQKSIKLDLPMPHVLQIDDLKFAIKNYLKDNGKVLIITGEGEQLLTRDFDKAITFSVQKTDLIKKAN